jgi:hypothetical protein
MHFVHENEKKLIWRNMRAPHLVLSSNSLFLNGSSSFFQFACILLCYVVSTCSAIECRGDGGYSQQNGVCESCTTGKYNNQVGVSSANMNCTPCLPNTFAPFNGTVQCIDCSENMHCPGGGCSVCVPIKKSVNFLCVDPYSVRNAFDRFKKFI